MRSAESRWDGRELGYARCDISPLDCATRANSPMRRAHKLRWPVRDGAGEEGGELGFGAAEAVGVGRRDVEGDVDAAAAAGAHAEAAVGAAGERQDGFGAALAGDAERGCRRAGR